MRTVWATVLVAALVGLGADSACAAAEPGEPLRAEIWSKCSPLPTVQYKRVPVVTTVPGCSVYLWVPEEVQRPLDLDYKDGEPCWETATFRWRDLSGVNDPGLVRYYTPKWEMQGSYGVEVTVDDWKVDGRCYDEDPVVDAITVQVLAPSQKVQVVAWEPPVIQYGGTGAVHLRFATQGWACQAIDPDLYGADVNIYNWNKKEGTQLLTTITKNDCKLGTNEVIWDGKASGVQQPAAIYAWTVKFKTGCTVSDDPNWDGQVTNTQVSGNLTTCPIGPVTIDYNLSHDATDVRLCIYDPNLLLIHESDHGSQTAGDHSVVWSGSDANGKGKYTFVVSAVRADHPNDKLLDGLWVHSLGYSPVSVALLAINSPLDANPNAGGGLRIFPDKQTPEDTVARNTVRVKAGPVARNAMV